MAARNTPSLRRSARNVEKNLSSGIKKRGRLGSTADAAIKQDHVAAPALKKSASDPIGVVVKEEGINEEEGEDKASQKSAKAAALLQDRKLKFFSTHLDTTSPFPTFHHPTARECSLAHRVLASMHGARIRPDVIVAPAGRSGCGNSPSVLDALVRTILSQNTSDRNSSRAKLGMDEMYGRSDAWDAIVQGGQAKLQAAIQSGGLAVVKSKVILSLLDQVKAKHGVYSLDHLARASNAEAMQELLSYRGVGPKTAGCVLMFCLRRESFAVDTHVYRITGMLGWRPPGASREEAQAHLNATIPDHEKYGLHVLLVTHGKQCTECRAGGKYLGKCALRLASRKGVNGTTLENSLPAHHP